jgi:putative transposase
MARNVTDESTGCLRDIRYVLHDRDTKFCDSFESILMAAGVKPLKLPARSPNLNAFAERWGALSERGMLVEADSFRRRLFEARTY